MERVALEDFSLLEDDLVLTYVAELRTVEKTRDVAALQAFADRWAVVFLAEIPQQKDPRLLPTPLDAKTFRCLRANRRGVCAHLRTGESCAGQRLALPELLMRGSLLAQKFSTPTNLAIRRLVEVRR